MSNLSHLVDVCNMASLNRERFDWLNVLFGQIAQEVALAGKHPSSQSLCLETISTLADIAELLTTQYRDELHAQCDAAHQQLEQLKIAQQRTQPPSS